jgi:hypothetical protein
LPARRVSDPLIRLNLRVPQSLRDQLVAQADEAGVTLSDLFRSHLSIDAVKPLGVPVKRRRAVQNLDRSRSADPVLLRNLAAIGSNLNQLSRAVNTGAVAGDLMQAVEILVVLRAIESDFTALVASNVGSPDAH